MRLFTLILALLVSSSAFAGEAYIPSWIVSSKTSSTFTISNASSVDAKVTAQFFDHDGDLYTGPVSFDNGGSITSAFTIPANETVFIYLKPNSNYQRGYGVIRAEASDPQSKSQPFLLAHGKYDDTVNFNRWSSITINGGKPFS